VKRSAGELVLGGLLAAMAVGQASDPARFREILAGYRTIPPPLEPAAAAAIVVAEAVAGATLLTGRGRRFGGRLAVGVATAWAAIGLGAFTRQVPVDNCGCFGEHLAQPLRWWVLVEDAELLALAVWVARRTSRPTERRLSAPSATP